MSEEMKDSYSKLGAKMLVNKLRASNDAEECEVITKILAERNLDVNGASLARAEAVQVEVDEETAEEKAAAEAAAAEEEAFLQKDPKDMTAKELKRYQKLIKMKEKYAAQSARAAQKAELNHSIDSEAVAAAKAEAKAKKQAEKLAKQMAKKAEALENRKAKLADASPLGSILLGKRVAIRPFGKTAEIIPGEVVGLVLDKRVNMMLVRIKGDDGRMYHKCDTSHDLFLIEQSVDEAGIATDVRNQESGELSLIEREGLPEKKAGFGTARVRKPATPEEEAAALAAAEAKLEAKRQANMEKSPYGAPLLGKRVGFRSFFAAKVTYGTAIALVLDKRVDKVLVRIKGEDGQIYHKVDTSHELYEADAEGNLIERELPEPKVRERKKTYAEKAVEATEPETAEPAEIGDSEPATTEPEESIL